MLTTPLMVVSMGLMALKVGQLALGSSAGRLFGPVVMILQQRLALGALGIDVGEFYSC